MHSDEPSPSTTIKQWVGKLGVKYTWYLNTHVWFNAQHTTIQKTLEKAETEHKYLKGLYEKHLGHIVEQYANSTDDVSVSKRSVARQALSVYSSYEAISLAMHAYLARMEERRIAHSAEHVITNYIINHYGKNAQ